MCFLTYLDKIPTSLQLLFNYCPRQQFSDIDIFPCDSMAGSLNTKDLAQCSLIL